ncbi:hypothetical protein SGPA1_30347 [Streptomyces misionensis JCM 4497]
MAGSTATLFCAPAPCASRPRHGPSGPAAHGSPRSARGTEPAGPGPQAPAVRVRLPAGLSGAENGCTSGSVSDLSEFRLPQLCVSVAFARRDHPIRRKEALKAQTGFRVHGTDAVLRQGDITARVRPLDRGTAGKCASLPFVPERSGLLPRSRAPCTAEPRQGARQASARRHRSPGYGA